MELTRITDEKKIGLVVQYAKSGSRDVMDLVDSTVQAQLEADQEKVQEIFEETELIILRELNQNLNNYPWWQARKERVK